MPAISGPDRKGVAMKSKLIAALLGGALALPSLRYAVAQDDDAPEITAEPLKCLSMASIRSTKVVDDSTVLFFHGRGRVYVNRLERECVGLARNDKFTYEVHTGARHARLCVTDSITVLERMGRGFNCGLGLFEEISRDEADVLLAGPNRAVTSTPVELPQNEAPAPPAAENEPSQPLAR
jgi:hypothetical protein